MDNMLTTASAATVKPKNERAETSGELTKPRPLLPVSETSAVPKENTKRLSLSVAQLAVITLNEILFEELPKHGVITDVTAKDSYGYARMSGIIPCRKCKRFALFEDTTSDRLCLACAEK